MKGTAKRRLKSTTGTSSFLAWLKWQSTDGSGGDDDAACVQQRSGHALGSSTMQKSRYRLAMFDTIPFLG